MNEVEVLAVDKAIHDGSLSVYIQGVEYPIKKSKNGCRTCSPMGFKFMEQNVKKETRYAKMAQEGRKITWILLEPGHWGLIIDNKIINPPSFLVRNVTSTNETKFESEESLSESDSEINQEEIKFSPKNMNTTLNSQNKKVKVKKKSTLEDVEESNSLETKDVSNTRNKRKNINNKTLNNNQTKKAKIDEVNDLSLPKTHSNSITIEGSEIDIEEIELGQTIGKGAFGEVKKGYWKKNGREVAIKCVCILDKKTESQFIQEANLLMKLKHPNVVRSYGVCNIKKKSSHEINNSISILDHTESGSETDSEDNKKNEKNSKKNVNQPQNQLINLSGELNYGIVMEYVKYSLFTILNTSTYPLPHFNRIILSIAKGIQYLHHQKPVIIHRDLKPGNILLDENFNAKIADFGVSRESFETASMTKIGTPRYMAPEILQNKKYNQNVDIYSFSLIIWQILTGELPFSGDNSYQVMMKVAMKKIRPSLTDFPISPFMSSLLSSCWHNLPRLRPDIDSLVRTIENEIAYNDGKELNITSSTPSPLASWASSSSSSSTHTVPLTSTVIVSQKNKKQQKTTQTPPEETNQGSESESATEEDLEEFDITTLQKSLSDDQEIVNFSSKISNESTKSETKKNSNSNEEKRKVCMYGSECYQKSEHHLKKFYHPPTD